MGSMLAFALLPLLLSTSSAAPGNFGWKPEASNGHRIDCPFPKPRSALPVLSLGQSAEFPWAAVKDIVLASAKKDENLTEVDIGNGTALVSSDRVAARLDKATGETTVFSRLGDLKPGSQFSFAAAKKYFRQKSIFPPDDTQLSLVPGQSVFNAGVDRSGNTTNIIKPERFLSTIHVQRNITAGADKYSVCGPGSKGTFTVDSTGNIVSLSHRWRSAKGKGSRSESNALPQSNIQDAITTQLTKANIANATIDSIELCYYDGGKSYIQPVYRFFATPNTTIPGIDVQRIVGYVPALKSPPEPVPELIPTEGAPTPDFGVSSPPSSPSKLKRQSSSPVGFVRYIMQNDGNQPYWLQDSQDFLDGLNLGSAFASIFCILGNSKFCHKLDNEQYYWSENRFYTNENNFFVDSAPLAYQENHGSPFFFCTDHNATNCGGVSLTDIQSTNGYGDARNGGLRYWINRACSFIPSPADMAIEKAAEPWWNVFDGLHVALGFRVSSYCRDGTTFPVGLNAALGAGMVSSWMHTVNDAKQYQGLAHGAASAINVCGHSDDTLYDDQNIGSANCLQFWWLA